MRKSSTTKSSTTKVMGVLFVALQLVACGGGDHSSKTTPVTPTAISPEPSPETPPETSPEVPPAASLRAIVGGVSSDFSSSDVSIVDAGNEFSVAGPYFEQSLSDFGLDVFGKNYYRLGRYSIDNVTKFNVATPETPVWQFSVKSDAESNSVNPYQMVFVSETKAYLLRYGSPLIWIVNPSVVQSNEAGFKTGEIDLSAYSDSDGVPEVAAGVVVNDKLYIVMQRLNYFQPTEDAYVAVIDVNSNTEIDTNTEDDAANLKGIKLDVRNPLSIVSKGENIYISAIGSYDEDAFTGGIEKINPVNNAVARVLDDGDNTSHPYGKISGMALVSETKGYFKGYSGWGSEALYQFNPSTGVVDASPVLNIRNVSISGLAVAPDSKLWVGIGDASAPHILVVDTAANSLVKQVSMIRNPTDIRFITE